MKLSFFGDISYINLQCCIYWKRLDINVEFPVISLLYLMVLADSHTISKSIDNDNKLDKNKFESIYDVDRPLINPKTRKDRQHKYNLYYSKDEDVVLPDTLKETKLYTELEKTTARTTTEHAKQHKSQKRRVGSFWRKLRGKDKKKDFNEHDSFESSRRISNHKKEQQKDSVDPGPSIINARRKNRKKLSLWQPEIKVAKRDASGLFSTRPYSNTPQSYKLQMGIAPQVDNMLKSKYRTKAVLPFAAIDAGLGVADNLQGQLESITCTISDLKERYGANPLDLNKPSNPRLSVIKDTVFTTEPGFHGTAQIELILNDMKARAMQPVTFQKPMVTDLISSTATETIFNYYPVLPRFGISAPGSGLTFISINENENLEKTTAASTKADEFNLNYSMFSTNTEAHYLAARSIKEETMTIAQNVEDMLQRELKNLYNKVKHKVSSDLRKEVHTVKSTVKEISHKISSKLSSSYKTTAKATRTTVLSKSTSPPKPRTCPCKAALSHKTKGCYLSTTTTTTTTPTATSTATHTTTHTTTAIATPTTTTAPRIKKKDDTEVEKLIQESFTPEIVSKLTYDDYMMLTLFEQILSKTRDDNAKKILATTELPVFSKNKRDTFRLSKRNPETLTDVKLREVIQSLYDDGGNMPDYDYIDPSANVSSTEKAKANNNYNDEDYVLDTSGTPDNCADGTMEDTNDKNKGTTPGSTDADHTADDSFISAADTHQTASGTNYEGLSHKISYNEFVNGYKHYLNFQKDQNNQNFSNMIKYQAHRHHSVDDIGKYILNKIPPVSFNNKKKREQRFSDDSENSMDYQEITTKSEDSWFKKHFYLFIDNGPPKKYHTSETVELKPPSTDTKLYNVMTEPTPVVVPKDKIFIKIDSDGVARKAKQTQEISLDDLSKVLDSIKDKQTGGTLSKAKLNVHKDTFNPIGNNISGDASSWDRRIISKFFAGKRRHASKTETTAYFPDYMFADVTRGRLIRSITKDNLENTGMADFTIKDIEASTGTKEVLANGEQCSHRGTNKFGYVDIDLVPRQTAIVKLRDNAKKSRFKTFLKKFNFKKKKPINAKPKRSCPLYGRRERFNPIKTLKSMFKCTDDNVKQKEVLSPDRLLNHDYNMENAHMNNYTQLKFANPLSVADMQKQIPNISDIYFEPDPKKSTTTKVSANYYHLDDKDQDLLYNYVPSSSSSKPPVTCQSLPAEQMLNAGTTKINATQAPIIVSTWASSKKNTEIQKIPPCNIMTVNVKTMGPSTTTSTTTETTLAMTIDDMSFILEDIQSNLKKNQKGNLPKETTTFNPYVRQTAKYNYQNLQPGPLQSSLREVLISSQLTRIAKFPIRKQRHKKKRHEDSDLVNIGKDYLSFDGPSVHDLGSKETPPDRPNSVKRNTLKKIHHSHLGKFSDKNKSRYTDYFNDLLMWHNDILSMDTVPNHSWANVLKTVQSGAGSNYTTPNMNSLLKGLKEMNDYLDSGDNVNRSAIKSPNKTLSAGSKDRVGVRQVKNLNLKDQGLIRSVAMDDNTMVTSKDIVIRGEAKYFQYNKPKKSELSSSKFIRKLSRMNVENYDEKKEMAKFKRKGVRRFTPSPSNNSEPAIILDTTLMAYDDEVDLVTKAFDTKKSRYSQSFRPTHKNEMDHPTFLKTNKPPMQYYTTPLPMKSSDFNKFLKDHHMDVDFVTTPILDLPSIRTRGPTLKKNEHSATVATTLTTSLSSRSWKTIESSTTMQPIMETNKLDTTKQIKTTITRRNGFTRQFQSKIESVTNALGNNVQFGKHQSKLKHKPANSLKKNKVPYWEDDFERYKRYSELRVLTRAAPDKVNKATQEANYYKLFKKKMKERLFEKKAPGRPIDQMTTDAFNGDQNKDVEITIINFDDIEKMTTHQPFDSFTFPALTREDISTFSNYGAEMTSETTEIPTQTTQKDKEMHNGLLYKDVYKERTTSPATTTTEYPTLDLKTTAYVNPIRNDAPPVTSSRNPFMNRYPYQKMPMYQSILRKNPHSKNYNGVPKRVHISSHHYKYDVIYDDIRTTWKNFGVEGSVRPKHVTVARPNGIRLDKQGKRAHQGTSNSYKGTQSEVVKNIDRTSGRNRYKRKMSEREVPRKKYKYFNTQRSTTKPQPSRGLTKTTEYFKNPILFTAQGDMEPFASEGNNNALASEKLLEEPFISAFEKSSEVSWTGRHTEPLSDIEDVMTLLDKPDMGVTMSDIDDAVTLSAMRSEFYSSDTIRDSARAALITPSMSGAPETKAPTEPTTKPGTTLTTSTPQPGSLVYNLKLKPTTSSSNPSKGEQNPPSDSETDRHRRLFKISSLLHHGFRGLRKNFTAATKPTNATVHTTVTTQSSKLKLKRTCDSFPDSLSPYEVIKQAITKAIPITLEPDNCEGCPVPTKTKCCSKKILLPPCQDESEDVTPASFGHNHKCKSNHQICDCELYVEPETYNDQQYYETGPLKCPCQKTTEAPRCRAHFKHCGVKREAQPNTFTAKDVAALEVIVDLMKNTLSYEENNMPNLYRHSNVIMESFQTTKPSKMNGSTNAIQVHIAIPFDFQNGKKRSPSVPGPVRVRKVFSAKMSTPVDLEYQVNSFEGTLAPTSTKPSTVMNSTDDGLSPGMYLLVDKPRDGFALKPVLGQINLTDLKARQAAAGTTVSMTELKPTDSREETTSMKSLAKVTLSKDFVAAVNQQLIEMYENMSRVNKDVNINNKDVNINNKDVNINKKDVNINNKEVYINNKDVNNKNVNDKSVRPARSVWKSGKVKGKEDRTKRHSEKYVDKRRINWEAVKEFFGHDRVCNCKCKSNKTMCRACAASDAVIEELIFEFDNIGQYMAEHCTEIQTFFWMNPIGGQRLRESVDKIDKSLSDYYKRVKGKCQGRLCKTFSNYIDKRQFTKIAKTKYSTDSLSHLINDLAVLAEDLNRTIALKVCYSDKLKETGDKFLHLMNNCIITQPLNKRSITNTTPKKLVQNVYSLDNINVNIICKPEASTTTEEHMLSATITAQDSPRLNDHLLDFDLEESKQKNPKDYKKLFPRKSKKSKLLSYFEFNKRSKATFKRQVDNQVATPLISDGGGAFWYDYLKTGTDEPRLARDSIKDTPNIEIAVVQRGVTTEADGKSGKPGKNDLAVNTIYPTVRTAVDRNQRDIETTTDSLSRNINQMLQLFGSLSDIESMNKNSNHTKVFLTTETAIDKAVSQDKPRKQSLTIVGSGQKMDKEWSKQMPTTKNAKQMFKSSLTEKLEELTDAKKMIESFNQRATNNKNAAKDLESRDDILIISTKINNATTCKMTTKTSPETDKILSTTNSVATNNATQATTIAPKSDGKLETTPTVGIASTKKLGFMKKLKAATRLIFRKEQTSQTPKKATKTPTQTTTVLSEKLISSTSSIIDIVSDGDKKGLDYIMEDSTETTSQNPTILIINDYGNEISSETLNVGNKEGYKNLLLSIIQFETNNLNEEWDRVAYGEKRRDETDIKRSIVTAPKVESVKPPLESTHITKPTTEVTYKGGSDQHETTKEPEGLLNKIVSKMGLKVAGKKKVVKKASIRDLKKERKKGNFIRNRKLRINSNRQGNLSSPESVAEACHTRRTTKPNQICDIQATYDHIQKLQKSLPAKTFEAVVRNITCCKYQNADSIFTIPYKKQGKRWDWIRKKRSLKLHFSNKLNDEHDFDDDAFVVNFEDDSQESYEKFVKGGDGIYKIVNRKKRTANLEALEHGLRNIPILLPGKDEVFVMLGDSVTLDCGLHTPVRTCDGKFKWKTDRKRMLKQDNVNVDGASVTIHNVEPRNVGIFTCSLDHTVRRNLRLNVLTVPSFDVVFLPVYKTLENCSYDELIAIQQLGGLMENETRCGKACSIRIDDPVCQRDKGTNSTLIRATAVMSMTPRELNCSLQCKRDIVSSLVLLGATNTAILSSISVLVSKDGVSETLMPWKDLVRPVVTHTLRKKDTNGHHEYNKLVPLLSPDKVDVVLICPAGYYLLPKYKLCSSCPLNTSSKAGDNTCRSCPRGTRAEPGAAKCHVVKPQPRRYDWWWYPPCGYLVACCGVLFGCTACVLLSVIVHVVSRDDDHREGENEDDEEQKMLKTLPHVTVAYAHISGTRPLSPSRVILPRFFRPSLTSSRATDSQETKFELWKERNRPPPLPPIDFDP